MMLFCESCDRGIEIPNHATEVTCSCGARYGIDQVTPDYKRIVTDKNVNRAVEIAGDLISQQGVDALAGKGPFPTVEKIAVQAVCQVMAENITKEIVESLKDPKRQAEIMAKVLHGRQQHG